jgi:cell division septum initiation protein DivIVA
VEQEVDTLFHELEHHEKTAITEKAQSAVKQGVKKVKQNVDDHDHSKQQTLPTLHHLHHYPYDWPHEDPEHRILHAIEAAEKAVLQAVNNEVNSIFHELEHHDDEHAAKQAQKVLEHGVAKANKHLDDSHEQRRNWFTKDGDGRKIEEYMKYGWAIQ